MILGVLFGLAVYGLQTLYCQVIYRWVYGQHLHWRYCWAAMPALLFRRRLRSWESTWHIA